MGVEAARLALRGRRRCGPTQLWFATADPAYLDKTNATAIHAALRLDRDGAGVRPRRRRCAPAVGALRLALDGAGTTLVVSADMRTGLPGERRRSRAAATPRPRSLVGDDADGPVIAESSAAASVTDEFLDRWRTPGRRRARRCGRSGSARSQYVPLGEQAWNAALKAAGLDRRTTSTALRVAGAARQRVGARGRRQARRRARDRRPRRRPSATPAPRSPACCSPPRSSRPSPARCIALVVLADGADVLLFRTTDALAGVPAGPPGRRRRSRPAAAVPYGKFLVVAGHAARSSRRAAPSRHGSRPRPRPAARTGSSASSARRSATPASCTCRRRACRATAAHRRHGAGADGRRRRARSSRSPSTASRTRRARRSCSRSSTSTAAAGFPSSSPTSTPTRSQIGDRVEMTFRRLFTADGIHNYFWKGRLVRDGSPRHQGPRRDRRDGLHALRRALGQGPRRPAHRRRRTRRSRRPGSTRTTSTPTGSAPRRAA